MTPNEKRADKIINCINDAQVPWEGSISFVAAQLDEACAAAVKEHHARKFSKGIICCGDCHLDGQREGERKAWNAAREKAKGIALTEDEQYPCDCHGEYHCQKVADRIAAMTPDGEG